jgi:hypothetical protein
VKESTMHQYLQLQIRHSANTIGATQLVALAYYWTSHLHIKGNVQQKEGGSKVVLFDGYGPCIVVLEIIFSI